MQVPRLRQRVVPALGRLAPPEWRDEPDFDLDYHLRWAALPGPGSMRQLLDLTATFVGTPFDRTRPLWEFLIVEGLEDGRAAMIQKLHHAIADGEGSIRMSEQFIDVARDATEPIAPDRPAPEPIDTSLVETTVDTLTHQLRRGLGIARRTADGGLGLLRDPSQIVGLAGELVGARAVRHAAGARVGPGALTRVDPALAPASHRGAPGADGAGQGGRQGAGREPQRLLRGRGGGRRRRLPPQGRRAGRGAAHLDAGEHAQGRLRRRERVHARHGCWSPWGSKTRPSASPPSASASTPPSARRPWGSSPAWPASPTCLPTSVAVRFARQQVETVDFTTSNVRGAPFTLYIAGARILANYPVGPCAGTAWNLTLMSYDGHLDMGLNCDAGAVEDPELLRDLIAQEYEALLVAGTPKPARPRAKKAAPKTDGDG